MLSSRMGTMESETNKEAVSSLFHIQHQWVLFATVFCPTVHMFPTIKQLSLPKSSTGINSCQSRMCGLVSLGGLVQSLSSILPSHAHCSFTLTPSAFRNEDELRSVQWICYRGRGQLSMTTELLQIPQQALLCPAPKKTAWALAPERPYPAASQATTCERFWVHV